MSIVSIIIPCYNEEKTISLLLDALYHQTHPISEVEVIIADGMSTDKTREKIFCFTAAHSDLHIMVVDNSQRNIPAGLNHAIEASSGKYIIRLDAHSIPSRDYIELCIKAIEENKGDNIGGVWDIRPGGSSWIARAIAAAASHPMGVGNARYRYTSKAGYVDTVPFGAYRRELFDEIGSFDETLLTNEDYELNARIRMNGGRIWLDPKIRSVYFSRSTIQELIKQYWRYGYWKWQMIKRFPSTIKLRQALPPIFVGSLLVLLILSAWSPIARNILLIEIISYFGILLVGTIPTMTRKKDIGILPGMPTAIAVMHLSWGSGLLWSMISSTIKLLMPQKTMKESATQTNRKSDCQ